MCASPHRQLCPPYHVFREKKNPPESRLLLLGTSFLSLIKSNLQLRPPLIGDHPPPPKRPLVHSLFQAFRQWGALRSKKECEKIKGLSVLRTALHYLNAWNRLTSPKHQNSPSQITTVGTSLVLSSRKRSRDAGSDLYNATFPESYTLLGYTEKVQKLHIL